jgi:WD40 repeat protein
MLTTATAHDRDVNVISWSRQEPFLLSGGDDGALKVWDLRQFKVFYPLANRIWRSHCSQQFSIGVRRFVLPWSYQPELGRPLELESSPSQQMRTLRLRKKVGGQV